MGCPTGTGSTRKKRKVEKESKHNQLVEKGDRPVQNNTSLSTIKAEEVPPDRILAKKVGKKEDRMPPR